ncbi:hypothetical protein L7F22_063168 [Adiantum nelumboides]|nr:hypothetical protein [Adiantum nelumboides]
MYCITSLSVAQFQYDPLSILYSRGKQTRALQVHALPHVGRSSLSRGFNVDPNNDALLPCRRAYLELVSTFPGPVCSFRVHREWSRRSEELGLCREFSGSESAFFGENRRKLGQLATTRRVSTCAFNPQNGGGGPSVRGILNLAGVGLVIYLFFSGRLDWLIDAVLFFWLISPVLWWLTNRFLIKGPCPNCGGEFQVFEFTLKEEYRLCPYCSQPFKLENKTFVRDAPHFSNQQARGFRQPFGGYQDFGGPTSSRKREDPSGVIVDVEAEVMDKD